MNDTISIERTDETTHGRYSAKIAGHDEEAVLTWQARGNTRIVDHTFVPPALRGQKIAEQLVDALIRDAREHGFTIEPQCSYVAAQFRRHPEWGDLRAPPSR
ncbi:GNAT family N-acetyltransferase [Altericroceibacterium xinjiangense]|uniref:GNAT family N-acetyltransferase n=1 Tax=Altericroceibacterium xinjiangense TaxID=762261 RepID=UPI000F7E6C3E|nr:GNAT family N-acetyltransferase [Altericroceibacterium xinjiangense]